MQDWVSTRRTDATLSTGCSNTLEVLYRTMRIVDLMRLMASAATGKTQAERAHGRLPNLRLDYHPGFIPVELRLCK